ncbi:B-cell antigen receptor complex-associated protein beta chain isoform X1 [Dendrobates tinctorius]|uniref:B-cell antigen receptor complex-associated protein beta chain isoform X1 n=1 Tax=Dendrobates tinctorius TaxID=92724 RepID=UPI003CC929DC
MNTSAAVLFALCIAALLLDQGCCARSNSSEESGMVMQTPRFFAVRKGRTVSMQCGCALKLPATCTVSWFRGHQNGSLISYVEPDPHIIFKDNNLIITNVQRKDSGVYFCKYNTSREIKQSHCGTELMIVGCGKPDTVKTRNTMKDAIIVIQTILIVLFVVVPITLLREMKRKRSLKIEDHTYEGLEAYQTATYEDIQNVRVLAAKTMEGEHPCLE